MDNNEILAWHFLKKDRCLQYGDYRKVVLGEKISVDPEKLKPCKYGLHASIKILDALSFVSWSDSIACRVKLSGKIINSDNKLVASERTVISWCESDIILQKFACNIAEDVLPIFEKSYPDDNRPRKSIEAKRLWLENKISYEDLIDARSAASAAASDAASDAAMSAANDRYNDWLEKMIIEEKEI